MTEINPTPFNPLAPRSFTDYDLHPKDPITREPLHTDRVEYNIFMRLMDAEEDARSHPGRFILNATDVRQIAYTDTLLAIANEKYKGKLPYDDFKSLAESLGELVPKSFSDRGSQGRGMMTLKVLRAYGYENHDESIGMVNRYNRKVIGCSYVYKSEHRDNFHWAVQEARRLPVQERPKFWVPLLMDVPHNGLEEYSRFVLDRSRRQLDFFWHRSLQEDEASALEGYAKSGNTNGFVI